MELRLSPAKVLDLFSLKGKTVFVIGGQGLLGQVACKTVYDLEGTPVTIDLANGANYKCDITDYNRLCQIASYHSVDAVMNCAIGRQTPVSHPQSLYQTDLQVGLVGAANVHGAFYGPLKATRGTLLNVGSDLSFKAPDPERYGDQYKPLAYSVVKHGIVGMTRYYAALWGKDGIRVNCLCPGSIDQGQALPRTPFKRLARAEEMSGPIAFLLSEASSYMTGACLSVDGGTTCW